VSRTLDRLDDENWKRRLQVEADIAAIDSQLTTIGPKQRWGTWLQETRLRSEKRRLQGELRRIERQWYRILAVRHGSWFMP